MEYDLIKNIDRKKSEKPKRDGAYLSQVLLMSERWGFVTSRPRGPPSDANENPTAN